jgi:hypothetical protein
MPAVNSSKYRVEAGWDDAPHLGAKEKREMLDATPLHLRDARSKGIPSMGMGAIYPYAVESIKVDPFVIPPHFRRGFALDDGWNVTAVGFYAHDPDQDILYKTAELYLKETRPEQAAQMILTRGKWLPGTGDAAARTRDGIQVLDIYKRYGLKLELAEKEVEAGIYDVQMRLASGRLKIFSTCPQTLWEYQRYRRDEKGKIVKVDDHAMDETRYACRPGFILRMIAKPPETILRSAEGLGGGDRSMGY